MLAGVVFGSGWCESALVARPGVGAAVVGVALVGSGVELRPTEGVGGGEVGVVGPALVGPGRVTAGQRTRPQPGGRVTGHARAAHGLTGRGHGARGAAEPGTARRAGHAVAVQVRALVGAGVQAGPDRRPEVTAGARPETRVERVGGTRPRSQGGVVRTVGAGRVAPLAQPESLGRGEGLTTLEGVTRRGRRWGPTRPQWVVVAHPRTGGHGRLRRWQPLRGGKRRRSGARVQGGGTMRLLRVLGLGALGRWGARGLAVPEARQHGQVRGASARGPLLRRSVDQRGRALVRVAAAHGLVVVVLVVLVTADVPRAVGVVPITGARLRRSLVVQARPEVVVGEPVGVVLPVDSALPPSLGPSLRPTRAAATVPLVIAVEIGPPSAPAPVGSVVAIVLDVVVVVVVIVVVRAETERPHPQ